MDKSAAFEPGPEDRRYAEQAMRESTAAKSPRWHWPPGTGHPLFLLSWFFWGLPVLWRVGNWIADVRFRLYMAYGWEWI